jgi:hypothetical protein
MLAEGKGCPRFGMKLWKEINWLASDKDRTQYLVCGPSVLQKRGVDRK